MNGMKRLAVGLAVVLGVAAFLSLATSARAGVTITNYTWTGGGDVENWTDSLNWTSAPSGGSYPGWNTIFLGSDRAIFPNDIGPVVFTNMPAVNLNGLQTGNRKVTFCSPLYVDRPGDNTVGGSMIIGSGGVEGTSIRAACGTYVVASCSVGGNVKADTFGAEASAPVLTGTPVFDVKTFYFAQSQGSGAYNISSNWNFINVDANNLTFRSASISGNYTLNWVSEPNFNGGRPNFYIVNCGDNASGSINISSNKLLGNVLQLDGWSGSINRFGSMRGDGGTVDLNEFHIGYGNGNTLRTWVGLTNSTIYIRGIGAVALPAWDNRSTNNTLFDVRTGTKTYFDPTGVSTQYVDTGSKDRNSVARDPVDWQNNFAFDQVYIGEGDIITLVGDANIEGGETNALYATRMTGLGAGGTVKLNGHNVYLLNRPANVTFDTTAGGRVYAPPSSGTMISVQ